MEKVKKIKLSSNLLLNVLKGAIIAVSFSLVLILIFALLIKLFNIPDVAIMPVNQALKIISIFFGCYFALKTVPRKGLITGALIGVTYTICAFLVFSALGRTFTISASFLNDLIFSFVIGAICGVFLVNKKIRNNG